MAKCPVCGTRKAKRKCLVTDQGEICSLCCGQTRQESSCAGCVFYQAPIRKYTDVPAFSVSDMDMREDLQKYSSAIENAIFRFDLATEHTIRDEVPIRIYERLLDKYHFGDESSASDDELVNSGIQYVEEAIQLLLSQADRSTLVKILSILRHIAQRRTRGRREYLQVVGTYAKAVLL